MEHEIGTQQRPSLLRLPKDSSKGIFDCLKIDDSINLVKTCCYLKDVADDHVFMNYSTFEINQSNYKDVQHIREYIGPHVKTLIIDCDASKPNWNLAKILADFKNVRSLKVRIANRDQQDPSYHQDDLSLCNFDNIEALTLAYCDSEFAKSFLQNFHQLKCLKIFTTNFRPNELNSVIRNNPDIENFIFCSSARGADFEFDYRLMEMTPNIRRLSISVSDDLNMKVLANLNQLTKLHINCQWLCVNDGLRLLARNGLLVDLQLLNAYINMDLFEVLKLFDKLQSLVITTNKFTTPDSTVPWPSKWPPKLRLLRLAGSNFTRSNLGLTIEHLKRLEVMDVGRSDIPAYNKYGYNDATELAQHIILSVIGESGRPRLDVILPTDENLKKKVCG